MIEAKIGMNEKYGTWELHIPVGKTFHCCSCLNDILRTDLFYFCNKTKRFWCEKCRVKDWNICKLDDDHEHFLIKNLIEVKE